MKKNKPILIVALLLVALAVFFVLRKKDGIIRKESRDFAIADTAAVTKIFIADRLQHSVTLERTTDGTWTVNKQYTARPDGIDLLLTCFKKMDVRNRVPKAGYNTVIKDLASKGVKCEVYLNHNNKPEKVYYVGSATQDVLGTYMMLENSTVPFIMEIPGFEGYLTPRYSAMERDWREKTVFKYSQTEIKSVSVQYNSYPENSFVIIRNENSFSVSSPATHSTIQHPNIPRIATYLSYFSNLNFETWDNDFTPAQRDSLHQAPPASVVSVTDVSGKIKSLSVYPKPFSTKVPVQVDSLGKPILFDDQRRYAFLNTGSELFTIQDFVFSKIFVRYSDFDLAATKKLIHNTKR